MYMLACKHIPKCKCACICCMYLASKKVLDCYHQKLNVRVASCVAGLLKTSYLRNSENFREISKIDADMN